MAEKLPKLPPGVSEAFLDLLEDWVQFCPALARLCESAAAGLMLSKAFTWSRTKEVIARDGWFYKSWREWETETCLSRREQQTAREIIRAKGFWEEDKRKVDGAPTMHYRLNFQAILAAHIGKAQAKMEKPETPNQYGNGKAGNAQSIDCHETPNETPDCATLDFHKKGQSYKEAKTLTIDTTDTRRHERPLSPSVLTIALRDFWRFYDSLPVRPELDPDRDRMARVRIAANKSVAPLGEVKFMLRQHPDWQSWPYLDQIDCPSEIDFPSDPKPAESAPRKLPVGMQTLAGVHLWEDMCKKLAASVSRHSYETWLRPVRAIGLMDKKLFLKIPVPEFKHIVEKFACELMDAMNGHARQLILLTAEELETYDFERKVGA